ncbi:MAG TPA: hypothetical protein VK558_09175 [Patescibacteria group bacterium]|nr:hypothetical protein [Patescibacteria group bacterium]
MTDPRLEDYLDLFRLYGDGLGEAYLEPEDERYRLLFDQLCRLLVRPSRFNATLPEPFRLTARLYQDGDAATLAHMQVPENRNFMLSDLNDYMDLMRRLGP